MPERTAFYGLDELLNEHAHAIKLGPYGAQRVKNKIIDFVLSRAAERSATPLSAFSCAKRTADPSNELAACRKHCGDCENCYCVGCESCIAAQPADGSAQVAQPEEIAAAIKTAFKKWFDSDEYVAGGEPVTFGFGYRAALATPAAVVRAAPADRPKDHEIRETINQLRDIAMRYSSHQSLRGRIAHVVLPLFAAEGATQAGDTPEAS